MATPVLTAALAGVPSGIQAQGVWQGRRQLFVRFAGEAETATMYRADALAREIDRILGAAEKVSNTVVTQRDGVERVLELGPRRSDGLAEVLFSVVHMIFTLGYMSQNIGDVLAGPYPELAGAVETIVRRRSISCARLLRNPSGTGRGDVPGTS